MTWSKLKWLVIRAIQTKKDTKYGVKCSHPFHTTVSNALWKPMNNTPGMSFLSVYYIRSYV